jgi:hypothetical protein
MYQYSEPTKSTNIYVCYKWLIHYYYVVRVIYYATKYTCAQELEVD